MLQPWWKRCGVTDGRLTAAPLRLVIFDCDGVLIDSEPPSNRLVAADLRARGSTLSDQAVQHRYAGKALFMIAREVTETEKIVLPEDWPQQMKRSLLAMLEREASLIPGARAMLDAVVRLGLPLRVASNSSHEEMAIKFRRTGLYERLAGRLHSANDVGRPKPSPDLFLAAAAAEGVEPASCLVVEDSDTGIAAANAAGMACVVLRRDGELVIPAPGAGPPIRRIVHLDELEPLLMRAMAVDAA